MRIMIDLGHPAHLHLFKNAIWNWEKKGHDIKIAAKDKDVLLELLDTYNFEYELVGKSLRQLLKPYGLIKIDYKLLKIAKNFSPDIILSTGSPYSAHVSAIIKKPHIGIGDSEPSTLIQRTTLPFTDVIITPQCFRKDFGSKHIRYNGYKELAYLDPKYFQPTPSILEDLGLSKDDKFIILRFVAWKASHDIMQSGFDLKTKRRIIKELEKYGKVFITSESKLPSEIRNYNITIPSHRIHDLLYYAQLLVGDTQTMTTEAAVLGTPAVRCNSFVGPNDMGNFIELEKKYSLIYNFRDLDKALEKAVELLKKENLKEIWKKKCDKLLNDKIDVTQFITNFVEEYPESFKKIKKLK